jgi:hypothetical protein
LTGLEAIPCRQHSAFNLLLKNKQTACRNSLRWETTAD